MLTLLAYDFALTLVKNAAILIRAKRFQTYYDVTMTSQRKSELFKAHRLNKSDI